jgi:hypothetical protein
MTVKESTLSAPKGTTKDTKRKEKGGRRIRWNYVKSIKRSCLYFFSFFFYFLFLFLLDLRVLRGAPKRYINYILDRKKRYLTMQTESE